MSKTLTLSTPQRRILEAFSTGIPLAAKDVKVASRSYTATVARMLHTELHMIYIAGWRRTEGNNNGYLPLFLRGNLPDAPKPVLSLEEKRSRKRVRNRQYAARKRVTVPALLDIELLPPALPSHTPRYGFWRI